MKRNILLIVFFIGAIIGCSNRSETDTKLLIADVRLIAGKQPFDVEKLIGKPDSTYYLQFLGRQIFCQFYRTHQLEIQYPNGIASDIIAYAPQGIEFNQMALAAFNLDYKSHPDEYMKDRLIRWNNIKPFSAISFYNPTKDSLGRIKTFNVYFKLAE
jgi:hypothetical protein